jgi:hypothetical protein
MALLAISGFKGEAPRVEPIALGEGFAQTALNVKLTGGVLQPINLTRNVHVFGTEKNTAYLNGATWIGWDLPVDVVPAPIAANRLYFTGDGAPKMLNGTDEYGMAIAAPTTKPTVALATAADPAALQTVYAAYTYVTAFGEESQPSPLSDELQWSEGVVIDLSALVTPPTGRNITLIRIYRSQTSASGATGLFFAAEIAAASTTYALDTTVTPLQEFIASTDYDPPPAGLAGITTLPNGMMAAFVGKDLYFCEPYQPHAWPEKYVLTVDFDIVGLAAFGSTVAVLTRGTPYVAQGTHPENFVMEKMEANLPCLSRRGIVDIGYAAAYPSTDGLVIISASQANIVTRGMFSRDQWKALGPESFTAANYDEKYIFTYTSGDFDLFDGGIEGVDTLPTDFLIGGTPDPADIDIITYDFGAPLTAFGEQRVGAIDLSGETPYFLPFNIVQPRVMLTDVTSGDLFVLQSDGVTVSKWDDQKQGVATLVWRSKLNRANHPSIFSCIMVRTQRPVLTGDTIFVEVFADGQKVHTSNRPNIAERIKSGFLAHDWEVEVTSNVSIASIKMAGSVEELMGAV